MVQTRGQRRREQIWERLEQNSLPSYDSEEECDNCQERGQDEDPCKRHRKRDDEPYSETVVAYKRRKPKR